MYRLIAIFFMGKASVGRVLYEEYLRDAIRRGDVHLDTTVRPLGNGVHLANDTPLKAREDLAKASWQPPGDSFHLQHHLVQKRNNNVATAHLLDAVLAAEKHDMLLQAAAARRRLGELVGGEEGDQLICTANDWMTSEGIANPDRMIEVVAPGFGNARRSLPMPE